MFAGPEYHKKVKINNITYYIKSPDCWAMKSLKNHEHWRKKLADLSPNTRLKKKNVFNHTQWLKMVNKLEKWNIPLKHEFKGIQQGGIIHPTFRKPKAPLKFFKGKLMHYLELELLAYKLHKKVINGTVL